MSIETLNLLSDSTFGDKLDEQNAILEDIRDNISGGSVPDATTSTKGIVQIGDNINVLNGLISVPNGTSSVYGSVRAVDSQAFTGNSDVPNMTLFNTLLAGKANTIDVHNDTYGDKLIIPKGAPRDGASIALASATSAATYWNNMINVPVSRNGTAFFSHTPNISCIFIKADILGYESSMPWNQTTAIELAKKVNIQGTVTAQILTNGEISALNSTSPNGVKYVGIYVASVYTGSSGLLDNVTVFLDYNL